MTITDQSNPDPGKKSDKLLVLLADSVAMVEHHQPAWTCLDFEKDYDDSVKMMIGAHPQIESPSHFIESSSVQFGQLWYMTEHFCKIKRFVIVAIRVLTRRYIFVIKERRRQRNLLPALGSEPIRQEDQLIVFT